MTSWSQEDYHLLTQHLAVTCGIIYEMQEQIEKDLRSIIFPYLLEVPFDTDQLVGKSLAEVIEKKQEMMRTVYELDDICYDAMLTDLVDYIQRKNATTL